MSEQSDSVVNDSGMDVSVFHSGLKVLIKKQLSPIEFQSGLKTLIKTQLDLSHIDLKEQLKTVLRDLEDERWANMELETKLTEMM